jgi:hypothetical protein
VLRAEFDEVDSAERIPEVREVVPVAAVGFVLGFQEAEELCVVGGGVWDADLDQVRFGAGAGEGEHEVFDFSGSV